jgi:hypothetical protein
MYVARLTMAGIGEVFAGANTVMAWLTEVQFYYVLALFTCSQLL